MRDDGVCCRRGGYSETMEAGAFDLLQAPPWSAGTYHRFVKVGLAIYDPIAC